MEWLEVTPEDKLQVMKIFNTDENRVKTDVELIKVWKTKQPHLPDVTDDFIEKLLLRNKFRVESTKEKLDNYFSLRGQNRDLIQDFDKIVPSKESTVFLPLIKLSNSERIIIIKLINFDADLHDTTKLIKLNLAVTELLLQYDYSVGIRVLIDFGGFTLKHLTKWNPILIAKHVTLIEKAYSCRILGIEILNFPGFATRILTLMKIMLRPKLYDRLKVHPNIESLHSVIRKNCLPQEYGGPGPNLCSLIETLDRVMSNHEDFFLKNYDNVAREELRPPEMRRNDTFGNDGTFKKLAVD